MASHPTLGMPKNRKRQQRNKKKVEKEIMTWTAVHRNLGVINSPQVLFPLKSTIRYQYNLFLWDKQSWRQWFSKAGSRSAWRMRIRPEVKKFAKNEPGLLKESLSVMFPVQFYSWPARPSWCLCRPCRPWPPSPPGPWSSRILYTVPYTIHIYPVRAGSGAHKEWFHIDIINILFLK